MKTNGLLILNTISNICTFITLLLALMILYYIRKYHGESENNYRQFNLNKIRKENSFSKGLVHFKKYKVFPKVKVPKNMSCNIQNKNLRKKPIMNNTYTPPIQEMLTFVPEKKIISNNCS